MISRLYFCTVVVSCKVENGHMMKRKIMIWTIGMGLSAAVMAQEPLSLHACMEYAVAHSTKRIIQDASYADALIERRDAILRLLLRPFLRELMLTVTSGVQSIRKQILTSAALPSTMVIRSVEALLCLMVFLP